MLIFYFILTLIYYSLDHCLNQQAIALLTSTSTPNPYPESHSTKKRKI